MWRGENNQLFWILSKTVAVFSGRWFPEDPQGIPFRRIAWLLLTKQCSLFQHEILQENLSDLRGLWGKGVGRGRGRIKVLDSSLSYAHADFEFQNHLTYLQEAAECGLKGRTEANGHYARLQDKGRIVGLGPDTLCPKQCLLCPNDSTTEKSVMVYLPDWTLKSTVERNFLASLGLSLAWAGPWQRKNCSLIFLVCSKELWGQGGFYSRE